jgi:hypothetical protein
MPCMRSHSRRPAPFPPRLHAHDHAFPTTAARCVLQVLTHTDVIAIPENSVSGFAGISFNGQRFQIKYLSKSKGTDAVRQRFACLLAQQQQKEA